MSLILTNEFALKFKHRVCVTVVLNLCPLCVILPHLAGYMNWPRWWMAKWWIALLPCFWDLFHQISCRVILSQFFHSTNYDQQFTKTIYKNTDRFIMQYVVIFKNNWLLKQVWRPNLKFTTQLFFRLPSSFQSRTIRIIFETSHSIFSFKRLVLEVGSIIFRKFGSFDKWIPDATWTFLRKFDLSNMLVMRFLHIEGENRANFRISVWYIPSAFNFIHLTPFLFY